MDSTPTKMWCPSSDRLQRELTEESQWAGAWLVRGAGPGAGHPHPTTLAAAVAGHREATPHGSVARLEVWQVHSSTGEAPLCSALDIWAGPEASQVVDNGEWPVHSVPCWDCPACLLLHRLSRGTRR